MARSFINGLVGSGLVGVSLVALALSAGCEKKGADAPAKPPVGQENPQSMLGKTAKMARETGQQITNQQTEVGAMADGVGTKAGEDLAAKQNTGAVFSVSGINFNTPAGWVRGQGSQFRVAAFTAPGDVQVVFFNAGGSVEGNVDRWKLMVTGEGGDNKFKQEQKTIGRFTVHTITMEGAYAGMSPSGGVAPVASGTRFMGIIVEGGPGPVQIRVTGKIDDVKAVEPVVKTLLETMKTN
jgi:hypothetical protein